MQKMQIECGPDPQSQPQTPDSYGLFGLKSDRGRRPLLHRLVGGGLLFLFTVLVGVSRAQDVADDPSGAASIPIDGTPVHEAISPYGDVDWYRFDPDPGVTLSFELQADEPPAIELYENDGVTLLGAWVAAGSYTFPARRATYLLKVKPAWDCARGDYTLVVRPRDPDDHANAIEQIFPEDQLSDAADWHVVHPVTIDYPGDRDFFRFTVSGPGAFQAVCGGWPYEVRLYDENGVLLMSAAGGNEGVTWAAADAGVYYLEVANFHGQVGSTNLVLRPIEPVDLAPVNVQATPAEEGRDDLTLDPGDPFHVDVEVRNLSGGDAILPVNLGINIFLSSDEVLNGDYPAGWLSHEFGHKYYIWNSGNSAWRRYNYPIETPGRYRLEWEVARYASDRAVAVVYVDDIELQDSGGNVYWTEDFEHDGEWGPKGWLTDAGDVPAALDSSDPHGGSYAASAGGAALQTAQNAKFSVDVDVTSSDSQLLFYCKGAGLDWPNEAHFTVRRILPGGESVMVSGDAAVEIGDNPPPAGVYYVLALVNGDRAAPDLDPANDVISAGQGNQITVNPVDFPDLEASNVQVQAARPALDEESAVEVTWTVSNVGAGDTNTGGKGWEDQVFISEDPAGKCDRKILASFPHAGDLAPDRASYTCTKVVYLPRGCTGTWYIGVETNTNWGAHEPAAWRDNNVAVCADPLDIAAKPRPNLVITQVQTDKPSYALGETMTITYTIKNIGDAEASQAFVDRFELSKDNVKDGIYEYWLGRNEPYPDDWSADGDNDWDWVKVGPFSAGTYTFEWRYQKNDWDTQNDDSVWIDSVSFDSGNTFETFSGADLPDGWQTDADFSWRVDTEKDADDDGSYSLRAGPLPDGGVTHLWVTKTVEEGAWVWFRAKTSTAWGDMLCFRERPPTLAPGESIQRVVHLVVPDDVQLIGSRRWLVVTIDSTYLVYEGGAGGEDDNEVLGTGDSDAGFGGSIEITVPPHPDLAVEINSVTAAARDDFHWGDLVDVTYTETNDGDYPTGLVGWSTRFYLSEDQEVGDDQYLDETSFWSWDCPTSCSGEWTEQAIGVSSGRHVFTWVLTKPWWADEAAEASAWLDRIEFPGGAVEDFEDAADGFDLDGWTTAGDSIWTRTAEDKFNGAYSMTVTSARPGGIAAVSITYDVPTDGQIVFDYRLQGNDAELRFYVDGMLCPGQSWTKTFTIAIPEQTESPASRYVLATSNWDNESFNEYADTANNAAFSAAPINILSRPPPDLVLLVDEEHPADFPTVLSPFAMVSFSWYDANVPPGDAPATDNWWDHVYLSQDDALDTQQDLQLCSRFVTTDVPVDGAAEVAFDYTFSPSPLPPPGMYHLFVRVDGDGRVVEKNDEAHGVDNNTYLVPTPVEVRCVDFEPLALILPDRISGAVDVSVSIRNNGNGDVPDGCDVPWALYLSTDDQFSQDDSRWSYASWDGGVPAGADVTQQVHLGPPGVVPGTYYVFLVVDPDNTIAEYRTDARSVSGEDNNVFRRPGAVQVVVPDLVVTSIQAPAVVTRGARASIQVTVRNQDAAPALASWADRLRVQDAANVYTEIGSYQHSEDLAPGEERTYTFEFTVPAGLAEGRYRIEVTADVNNEVTERSESNNTLKVPATIDDPGAMTVRSCDLVPEDVASVDAIMGGSFLTVHWRVRNAGAGTTPKAWTDVLVLSDKSTWDEAQGDPHRASAWIDHDLENGIEPGGTLDFSGQILVPADIDRDGDNRIYLYVVADYSNQVPEQNADETAEANNVASRPTPLSLGVFDIEMVSPAANGTDELGSDDDPFLSGDAITVTWIVRNAGTVTVSGSWTESLFISTNTNPDAGGDAFLGSVTHTGDVAAGESYEQTWQGALPQWNPDWDGRNLYLKIVTDAAGAVAESDEDNNIGIYRLHMVERPAPDLRVTAVPIPPGNLERGGVITISYDLENHGALDAVPPWFDSFRLVSVDRRSVIELGAVEHETPDAVCGANAEWQQVTVEVPAGEHTLAWVFRRPASAGAETDAALLDDVFLPLAGGDQTVAFDGPGLPAGFESSADEEGNSHWTVITDQGHDALGAARAVGLQQVGDLFVLRYTGDFRAGQVSFWTRVEAHELAFYIDYGVPAHSVRTFTKTVTIPAWVEPGNYRLQVEADSGEEIPEPGREDNNTAASDVFAVALGPYPDLAVANLHLTVPADPADVRTGDTVQVTWSVVNQDTNGQGADAEGGWCDVVYLSTDNVLDAADAVVGNVWHNGGLARQAAYTASARFRLPDGPAAQYWVFVKCNAQIFENNQTDNNVSDPPLHLDAARGPYPDLVPFEIWRPDATESGGTFTTWWKVENAGDGPASGQWYDFIYLSRDDQVDGQDRLLAQKFHDGDNMPFTTDPNSPVFYLESATVAIPTDVTGAWRLIVVVDADDNRFEYSDTTDAEANNVLASEPFVITTPETPNLIVSGVQVERLETRTNQIQLEVQWTVKNIGATGTGSDVWKDAVYFSTAPNLFGEKFKMLEVDNLSYLEPGESYTRTAQITVPWEFAEGDYYVVVQADSHDQVFEFQGEGDNTGVSNDGVQFVTVHIPFLVEPHPYVAVLSSFDDSSQVAPQDDEGDIVVLTPVVATGERVRASWTAKNIGDASMTGSHWDDGWALSADTHYDPDDFWLGSHNYHSVSLAPGQTDRLENNVAEHAIPPDLPAGEYYLLIVADTHLFGSKWGGNVAVAPQKVRVVQAPPPDVLVVPSSVQCLTAPEDVQAGQPIHISWRVENRGFWETREHYWFDEVRLSRDSVWDPGDIPLVSVSHSGALAAVPNPPSASDDWYYEAEWTGSLPRTLEAGDWYILVRTAPWIFEGDAANKANNTAASTVPVAVQAGRTANLVPVSLEVITPDSEIRGGGPVEIRWTVENRGVVETERRNWIDTVYFASADNLAQRRRLESYNVHLDAPLAPGRTYTATARVLLPEDVSGDIHFIVVVDSSRTIFEGEGGKGDNTWVGVRKQVQEAVLPDLVISDHAILTTNPVSGQTLEFRYTVTNAGPGDTLYRQDRWIDSVYLSNDAVLDGSDQQIARYERRTGLPAGQSYTVTKRIPLDRDLQGRWRLFVTTDAGGMVTEVEDGNNTSDGAAFDVALSDVPDLQVDAIDLSATSPSIAPPGGGGVRAAVLSGQTVSGLRFTVRNHGTAAAEGSWADKVLLSRDPFLDARDISVASVVHRGPLAAGDAYTVETAVTIPPGLSGLWYLLVQTDANDRVYERSLEANNVRPITGEEAFEIILPPDQGYDLQVAGVTVRDAGGREAAPVQPGETLRVSWTVTNAGGADIPYAAWLDAVYLSTDEHWDSSDVFLAQRRQAGTLGAGHSYTVSDFECTVPAVKEGEYYVIVRTDVRQNVIEIDETNNFGATASDNLIDTTIPELHIEDDPGDADGDGVSDRDSDTGPMTTGTAVYRRVEVEPGHDLEISLACSDPAASTQLYVRFGDVAGPTTADYVYTNHFAPNQRIVVAGTRGGVYYIMARGRNVPNGGTWTLTVRYLRFEITTVSPSTVGNAGRVTFGFEGALFRPETRAVLVSPTGRELEPEETFFVSPERIFATFDMTAAEIGSWDVRLINPDDAREAVTATDAVTVLQGAGGRLSVRIDVPPTVRPNSKYFCWVRYANIGDADIPAPLLYVRAANRRGVRVRLFAGDQWRENFIQILGINRDGPADRLPPGAEYSIPITFSIPEVGRRRFTVSVLDSLDRPLDWDAVFAQVDDADAPADATERMHEYLVDLYGGSFPTFAEGLRRVALRLWRQGRPTYDVRDILGFSARRGYERAVSAVTGFLRNAESGAFQSDVKMVLWSPDGAIYTAITDNNGAFHFWDVAPGRYVVRAEGLRFDPEVQAEVRLDTDALGLVLDGLPADVPALPAAQPEDKGDTKPFLANGPDGTLHLVWSRGWQIWHAVWNADAGGWNGTQTRGVTIQGFPVPNAVGSRPRLVPFPAADPDAPVDERAGVLLVWQTVPDRDAGMNRVHLMYCMGRPIRDAGGAPTGQWEWTSPESLTGGQYGDTQPASAAMPDGNLVTVFLQRDWDIENDDTDLYWKTVTPPAPSYSRGGTEELPRERILDLDIERGLANAAIDRGGSTTHTFEFKWKSGTSIPSGVPLIGGRYGYSISVSGSLELSQCQVTGKIAVGSGTENIDNDRDDLDGNPANIPDSDSSDSEYGIRPGTSADETEGAVFNGGAVYMPDWNYSLRDGLALPTTRDEGVSIQVGDHAEFSGGLELSATWKAVCKGETAEWQFNQAALQLSVGGAANIPGWTGSVGVASWEIGVHIDATASLGLEWKGSNFGGWPSGGSGGIEVGLGPYGKVEFAGGIVEATVTGTGFVKVEYRPSTGVKLAEYGFKVQAQGSCCGISYKWEKKWAWPDSREHLRLGLWRETPDPDTLRIIHITRDGEVVTRETLTLTKAPSIGTGNDYSEDGAAPVETPDALASNVVIDTNPTLAVAPDGSVLLVWAHESGNTVRDTGSYLRTAVFSGRRRDAAWSMGPDIAGPTMFNRNPAAVFTPDGTAWVVWAASPATVNVESTAAEIDAALRNSDIWISRRVNGQWTAPEPLVELAGEDITPSVASDAGGNLLVTWVHRDPDADVVYAMRYDAASEQWSPPEPLSTGARARDTLQIVDAPTAGFTPDGLPLVAWVHTLNPGSPRPAHHVAYRVYDANAGWQPLMFFGKPLAVSREEPAASSDDETLARAGATRLSIAPPWPPPEECQKKCEKCKEGSEDENCKKDEEKPDPPDPDPPSDDPPQDPGVPDSDDPPPSDDDGWTECIVSHDPNEKHGPEGVGDAHIVASDSPLSYTILFENTSDAGPASVVKITDEFSDDFDVTRFRLGEIAFGSTLIQVPENRPFHYQTLHLENGMDLIIVGSIDPATRTATWEFRTVDPATGDVPANPLLGFLPPNDENGSGEGHVTFTIAPKSGLPDGTVIRNQAVIVFDRNDAIVTNVAENTLSSAVLDSRVADFSGDPDDGLDKFDGDVLTVTWGPAEGSAVPNFDAPGAGYDVYYAVNDEPYTLWINRSRETSALLQVTRGYTYRFYSILHDGAGNVEPAPTTPDAAVRILHQDVILSGTVSYAGRQSGSIVVQLFAQDKARSARGPFDGVPAASVTLAEPGGYAFDPVEGEGKIYALRAFIDADGDQAPSPGEALAETTDIDPVGRAPDIIIDLALADPDSDADGLPDWWEYHYFGDLAQAAWDDPDSDGDPNGVEYQNDTDPTDGTDASGKPTSTASVQVHNGFLYVDGAEFVVRGVLYRPAAPGESPASGVYTTERIQRDIPLIAAMGANTVRTTIPPADLALLDACDAAGLRVILGFPVDPNADLADPAVQDAVRADFATFVQQFKDHPALLMWCIGDRVNENLDDAGKAAWYRLLNSLAWTAYSIEGAAYHPVTTANAGLADLATWAPACTAVDLWGVDFSGRESFDTDGGRSTLFADYAALNLGKPLWIAAYGVDAWNEADARPNDVIQGRVDENLARTVEEQAANSATFQAARDVLISIGATQDVVDGDAGVQAGPAFLDIDGNGRWDPQEDVWFDTVISRRGVFEAGADAVIAGTPADGAAGIQTGIAFYDENGNGRWDDSEDIWKDAVAPGALPRVFDDTDELLYTGAAQEVTAGHVGLQADVFYEDVDGNGEYSAGEPLWQDEQVGAARVFDAAIDSLIYTGDVQDVSDGDQGLSTGLYWHDVDGDGAWSAEEDVWAKSPGGTVGGVVREYLDQWWLVPPSSGHDVGPANSAVGDLEFFGLFRYTAVGGALQRRLAYRALQCVWTGVGIGAPIIEVTEIETDEDTPVTFPVRVLHPEGWNFVLVRPNGGLHGRVVNWTGRGDLDAVTYEPDADFTGADRIDFRAVSRDGGEEYAGAVVVQVNPVDDPPKDLATEPGDAVIEVHEEEQLTITLSAAEVDGQDLTWAYEAVRDVLPGAELSATTYDAASDRWTATLTWTPGYDEASLADPTRDYVVTFTATDASGNTAQVQRTIRVLNVNRQPAATTVTITPSTPFATEPISVVWDGADPDGDPLTGAFIRWFKVSGDRRTETLLPAFSDQTTIPAGAFAPGDLVVCKVWPTDGDLPGAVADDALPAGDPGVSEAVTVLNAVQSVTVGPDDARTGDDLTFTLAWMSSAEPQPNYDVQWFKDGVPAGTDAVVSHEQTARGQQWQVRITAWVEDGRQRHEAPPVDSPILTIQDTPPPAPTAAEFANTLPQVDDDLEVINVTHGEDADGDPITIEVQWSKSPDFAAPVTGNPLPAAQTAFRDGWYARVRCTAPDGSRGVAVSDWYFVGGVRVGLTTFDLKLWPGWNLVSLPLAPVDRLITPEVDESTAAGLFGDLKQGTAWYWRNDGVNPPAYEPVDPAAGPFTGTLQALRGFWVYHVPQQQAGRDATPTVLTVAGWPLQRGDDREGNEQMVTLQPGWNLFGPCADFATAPPQAPGLYDLIWTWWNRGGVPYYRALDYDALDPAQRLLFERGFGYWLLNLGDQPLDLDLGQAQ